MSWCGSPRYCGEFSSALPASVKSSLTTPPCGTECSIKWPGFPPCRKGLFVFIGVCEGLGGIGLIVPAMTRVAPRLTPITAAGLAIIMILAAGFHIARGEYSFFLPINLVLGGVAAFIAYGRLVS